MSLAPPPKELPKISVPQKLLEERVVWNREKWKKIFDLYAVDGKLDGRETLRDMLHGSGSGFLEREIDEVYNGLGKPPKIVWNDLKGLCSKDPSLAIAWDAQAKIGKGSEVIAIDVFEQLFVSFQYLLDSSPDNTKLDVSYLAYLLSSCGEELSTDFYDEFIKTLGHTTKGAFSLSMFLNKYAQFAKKVGVFNDEQMQQAQVWIDRSEEKYGIKKKVHKRPVVEEKPAEPVEEEPHPDAEDAAGEKTLSGRGVSRAK
jgi:Ca2+-binding EF-hand superfamily protein